MTKFNHTKAFAKLESLASKAGSITPQRLFAKDDRFVSYSMNVAGLHLDYSKNLVDEQIINALFQLSEERQLKKRISDWLGGAIINTSENKPALHNLLRASDSSPFSSHVDYKLVAEQTVSMYRLDQQLNQGLRTGCTGKAIDTIVNIGIGGSSMGVQAIYHGLSSYRRKRQCHFIVNIDPSNRIQELDGIDFESSIFLVSSKSFSTLETLTNYQRIYSLVAKRFGRSGASQHFIAITANQKKAQQAGFIDDNIITFPQWVGGRFSVWSAVGLPLLLCYGREIWQQLLKGAESIDQHLATTEPEHNMPIILALLGIWQRTFLHINNHSVLCYSHNLRYFTDHLQQLVMESNGKSVLDCGEVASFATGEIIWGGENSNGQHSYFQWLHQANTASTCDFIITARNDLDQHSQNRLIAMALGQSRSLFFGDKQPQSYSCTDGSRQSNSIIIERLTAESLGALTALYEHKTVLMALIWGINPFDQWGVEAGKKSASTLHPYLDQSDTLTDSLDQSTAGLINILRSCF